MNVVSDKWLNIEMKGEKEATLKISGIIGGGWFEEGATKDQVSQDLEDIKAIKANVINVEVDSLGGSVLHGIAIYDMLKKHDAQIKVDVTGWTASIATVIAMAADPGELRASKNQQWLVHEARGLTWGTASTFESYAREINRVNDQIADIYVERTGKTKEAVLDIMGENQGEGEFYTTTEAMEQGFIDSVYSPSKSAMAAQVTQETLNKFKIKAKLNIKDMSEETTNVEETTETPVVETPNAEGNEEKVTLKSIAAVITATISAAFTAKEEDDKLPEVDVTALVEKTAGELRAEFETQLTAEVEKRDAIQAKLDASEAKLASSKVVDLNAKKPTEDPKLEGDAKPTGADAAAEQFKGNLSEGEKIVMNATSKKED